jgi:hypothetical protein
VDADCGCETIGFQRDFLAGRLGREAAGVIDFTTKSRIFFQCLVLD